MSQQRMPMGRAPAWFSSRLRRSCSKAQLGSPVRVSCNASSRSSASARDLLSAALSTAPTAATKA